MNQLKKIEEIKKMKDEGTLTEDEFNKEKEKILNQKIKKFSFLIIAIILLVIIIAILFNINKPEDGGFEIISSNILKSNSEKVSFKNMSADDKNLDKVQQEIIKYFDNDYFYFDVEDSQRYPQVFKGAKVTDVVRIVKVLKSTDDEFEVVAYCTNGGYEDLYYDKNLNDIPESELFVIKGQQLEERLIKDDYIDMYGRYIDINSFEIDGKTYSLPVINLLSIGRRYKINSSMPNGSDESHRYNFSTVKTVAEYIFGKDIKITEPEMEDIYWNTYGYEDWFYMITLDNQSNANFKVFDMHREFSAITYNPKYNEISNNIAKKLFISADFNHYIVTTYDNNTKHIYLDYFDRNYNKLWSREFDSVSTNSASNNFYNFTNMYNNSRTCSMDYSDSKMAFIIDTDLYLIDINTGKNLIEPVIIGDKTQVNMMEDGIVLIGTENKDTIVKVGYDGKILYRLDGDTNISNIDGVISQIVNGKLVIYLQGYDNSNKYLHKYMVVNNDGSIESASKDISY